MRWGVITWLAGICDTGQLGEIDRAVDQRPRISAPPAWDRRPAPVRHSHSRCWRAIPASAAGDMGSAAEVSGMKTSPESWVLWGRSRTTPVTSISACRMMQPWTSGPNSQPPTTCSVLPTAGAHAKIFLGRAFGDHRRFRLGEHRRRIALHQGQLGLPGRNSDSPHPHYRGIGGLRSSPSSDELGDGSPP